MSIPTALLRKHNSAIQALFKEGLISSRVAMMLHIRDKIDALMRAGKSRGQAVNHVANEMNMKRTTLYDYL